MKTPSEHIQASSRLRPYPSRESEGLPPRYQMPALMEIRLPVRAGAPSKWG